MEYIRLGNTGLKVSRICLGTMTYGKPSDRWPWALNEEQSKPFFQKALELGINFFDTADMYSYGTSEEVVGNLLKEFARRDEVVIATKVFQPMSQDPNDGGLSRKSPLHRCVIDAQLAICKSIVYRRFARLDAVRLHAAALQPDLPGRGA